MTNYERRLMRFRNRKKGATVDEGSSETGATKRPEAQEELAGKTVEEVSFNDLREEAKKAGLEGYGKMTKPQLYEALKNAGKL